MPIYEFQLNAIAKLPETTFGAEGLLERIDLQRLLRDQVDVIAPDTLVIAEEFGDWEDSRRRIDLLAIDKDANLVVIELKRTEDGGHMDLQSIRYASMVSTLTFDQAVTIYDRYLSKVGRADVSARDSMLDFLGWAEPTGEFATDVRIVLASAAFSKEVTSSVLWLNDHGTDIRCVRLKPYNLDGRVLVDVQQIIPTPEAADYQVQIQEKARSERQARKSNADFTRFDVDFDGQTHEAEWKRNAIFLICKHICTHGVAPDELTALFDWRPSHVWYTVDGEVDANEFKVRAAAKAAAGGQSFNGHRWFCDDDELVHAGGRTYAFSTQWGGPNWFKAMGLLKERYPAFKIDFRPTQTKP